ncbi:RRS1-domain-containing protein [Meredithblackwellia eburnea MCA 4105]
MATTSTSQAPVDVSAILAAGNEKKKAITVEKEIPVDIDLGLLAVFDPNPIEQESYRLDKEQSLLQHARDGIQLLVNSIWSQPTRIVDDGVVASLPPVTTVLPREKPLPKPKPMTKWEAFAATKGIAPKPKRDRLVFDEEKQDWVPRWGYKGKNKETEDQWIVEVPNNKDANFDPVTASKNERKARKLKNESQRLKNLQRAAANAASGAQTQQAKLAERESRKGAIERELKVTKTSTASLGRFDDKLKGEKKEKNVKRKFDANEVSSSSERSKALSILTKIGATPSNKRTRVSDDAPDAGKGDGLVNSRKAIKHLTGGRGTTSLGDRKGKGRGGKSGRGRNWPSWTSH